MRGAEITAGKRDRRWLKMQREKFIIYTITLSSQMKDLFKFYARDQEKRPPVVSISETRRGNMKKKMLLKSLFYMKKTKGAFLSLVLRSVKHLDSASLFVNVRYK